MRVLVTGGAGYIGSHTCIELLSAGHQVLIIDNLSNGYRAAIERIKIISSCQLEFIEGDIRNNNLLNKVFDDFNPDAVIHFAGFKAVSESVFQPLKYYNTNVSGSINLLHAMERIGCARIVFSSSATVYGVPKYLPLDELHSTKPINPYGRTKLMVEEIIRDWVLSDKSRIGTILRYFNPVGAHSSGLLGEEPQGIPNNLMPFIAQVASGRRNCLSVFGDDYNTKDGTALRDYIHVVDLADAHLKTIERQTKLKPFEILNIGRGKGVTVLELIKSFEKNSNISLNYKFVDRRLGDLPELYADTSRALDLIKWKAKFTIDQMCRDTWNWSNNNKGFHSSNEVGNVAYDKK
jgi:UDP-glucose 4-epimerase